MDFIKYKQEESQKTLTKEKPYVAPRDTNTIRIEDLDSFRFFLPRKSIQDRKYIYVLLLRILFLLDFMHDFCDTSRSSNMLYTSKKKYAETKKRILRAYVIFLNYDIQYIQNLCYSKEKVPEITLKNLILPNKSLTELIRIKLVEFFTNIDNLVGLNQTVFDEKSMKTKLNPIIDELVKLNETAIKSISKSIIEFIGISSDSSDKVRCNKSFDDMFQSLPELLDNNLRFSIDADKNKLSYYPLIIKLCNNLFTPSNTPSNTQKIIIQSSIINNYDAATTSNLNTIYNQLKNHYVSQTDDKDKQAQEVLNKKIFDKKILKEYDDNNQQYINLSINEEAFIKLKFKKSNENTTELIINQFFSISNELDISIKDSSLGNITTLMELFIDTSKIKNFITTLWNKENQVLDSAPYYKNQQYDKDAILKNNKTKNLLDKLILVYPDDIMQQVYSSNKIKKSMQNFMNDFFREGETLIYKQKDVLEKIKKSLGISDNEPETKKRKHRFGKIDINLFNKVYYPFVNFCYDAQYGKFIDQSYINKEYDVEKITKLNILNEMIRLYTPIYEQDINHIYDDLIKLMNIIMKIYSVSLSIKTESQTDAFLANLLSNKYLYTLSLYKSMGDFGQILYCKKKSLQNDRNTSSIFITFDILCSHISSLFNYTILENSQAVLSPLSLYFPKEYSNELMDTTQFGKSKQIQMIFKAAQKYNIPLTYKTKDNKRKQKTPLMLLRSIQQLNTLHITAKKLKIPITYKSSDKSSRKYKAIDRLKKEIRTKKEMKQGKK